MEETQLIHLNLHAPLEYTRADIAPFSNPFPAGDETAEFIFCFELDRQQAKRIDPDPAFFPGRLVFSGKRNGTMAQAEKVRLPAGLYAFSQKRSGLNREECVFMASEQQKDGLWERLHLGNLLYIRRLFEDGSPVTQFFRNCEP